MRALFALRHKPMPRTVLVSCHLLSDLERVVGHVMFLREGRLQLFVECDGAIEHLRCLPSRERPTPRRVGALHWAGGRCGWMPSRIPRRRARRRWAWKTCWSS